MCSDYAILLVAFGLDSPLPRRDQLLRLGKRLKKSVSVYMCLRLCYPFPGKEIIRLVKKLKNWREGKVEEYALAHSVFVFLCFDPAFGRSRYYIC